MATINKQQFLDIIKNKPEDVSSEEILNELKGRGYQIEGDTSSSFLGRMDQRIVGAGKGVISTLKNTADLGEKLITGTLKTVLPKSLERGIGLKEEFKPSTETIIPKELYTAENKYQKQGFAAEQIGEFFIPIPGLAAEKIAVGATRAAKAIKIAKNIGKQVIDLTGKTALQTGGDTKKMAVAMASGTVGGIVGEIALPFVVKKSLPGLSKWFDRVSLKMTNKQATDLEQKIKNAVDVLQENKITGNKQSRYIKVKKIYDETEKTFQSFLDKSGRSVDKQTLINELEQLKPTFAADRNKKAIESQIDGMIDNLKDIKTEKVDVGFVNTLARSTSKEARKPITGKVSDEAEESMAQVLKRNVLDATDGLKIGNQTVQEFNTQYGKIIDAKKILNLARQKAEVSKLASTLMGMLVGGGIGLGSGGVGAGVGAALGAASGSKIAEVFAGTLAKSLAARGLQKLSGLPAEEIERELIKIITPLINQNEQ